MLFSSITFLYYFLPLTLLIYFVMPRKGKNAVLLAASFLFYFWGEPKYCFLMAGAILTGYCSGILIERLRGSRYRKPVLALALCVLLLLLGIFKYLDFFIQCINSAFGSKIALVKLALPIGISFYMFQIVSYCIDVYRDEVKAEYNILDFAMYVSLFPQLIAGPIVRYETVSAEIKHRTHSFEKVSAGIGRFVIGLCKKVLIADSFGLLVSQLEVLEGMGTLGYWLIACAYTMQIYFDFSGYSDMAIGLGGIFGFTFPENFNYPYISRSITEFWRRWHMTLGGWFRDYVYIPLGGNRVSLLKWFRNVLIVWALSGLWHGAAMNFVIWGVYYGIILILEKLFLGKLLKRLPVFLQSIYTMLLVIIGFAIFRTEDLAQVLMQLKGMLGFYGSGASVQTGQICLYYLKSYAVLFIISIIGATPVIKWLFTKILEFEPDNSKLSESGRKICMAAKTAFIYVKPVFYILCMVVVTAYLLNGSFNAFLYFRF